MANEWWLEKVTIPPSETNLQGEFYHRSRLIGLQAYLEFKTPLGIPDIAILNKWRSGVIAVVECKRQPTNHNTWQARRYEMLGVPLYWCEGMKAAIDLPAEILAKHGEDVGTPIDRIMRMPKVDAKGPCKRKQFWGIDRMLPTDRPKESWVRI